MTCDDYVVPIAPWSWRRPNLLDLRVVIDTNLLDEGRPFVDVLRRMEQEQWLAFQVTDTLLREVLAASDPAIRDRLLALVEGCPIAMGPAVRDQSLCDYAVYPSEQDQKRLEDVHQLIWQHPWSRDASEASAGNRTAGTRLRDTMHVATAIRYGSKMFITNDAKVYAAAERLAQDYPNTRVCSPQDSLVRILNEIDLHRLRWDRSGYEPPLPVWPDAAAVVNLRSQLAPA